MRLRKMYSPEVEEYVSVIGTDAFMDFVESIQAEGVQLERSAMGAGTKPRTPLVVEVDTENENKDLDELDIEIPILTPRVYREYKNLADLKVAAVEYKKVPFQQFSEEEQRKSLCEISDGENQSHDGARYCWRRGLSQRDWLLHKDDYEGSATGQRL